MNTYQCPKCNTEFSSSTKFCQNCGCNLQAEFIETPTCPKCGKTFSAGTKFCPEDGAKLVSPEKLMPRCVKCGKEYTDGTKFCPEDGGQIKTEALKHGSIINDDVAEKTKEIFSPNGNTPWGKIAMATAIIAALIDVYIILHYFSLPEFSRTMVGGFVNAFPLYLKHEMMGWIIFALVLAGVAKFIGSMVIENDDKYSESASKIAGYAGGLAGIFLLVGLCSKLITGF